MTSLRLDYHAGTKPFPWVGAVLLASAIAVSVLAGIYYRELTGKAAYWEARGGQAAKAAADGRHGNGNAALEIKHANEVLNRIALPWDQLFDAVESSSGKDVALLAMEPDAEKRALRISGEAKNIEAVLDYVGRLGGQQVFSSVYLQNHQVQLRDPDKPVRFALVATWKAIP